MLFETSLQGRTQMVAHKKCNAPSSDVLKSVVTFAICKKTKKGLPFPAALPFIYFSVNQYGLTRLHVVFHCLEFHVPFYGPVPVLNIHAVIAVGHFLYTQGPYRLAVF